VTGGEGLEGDGEPPGAQERPVRGFAVWCDYDAQDGGGDPHLFFPAAGETRERSASTSWSARRRCADSSAWRPLRPEDVVEDVRAIFAATGFKGQVAEARGE